MKNLLGLVGALALVGCGAGAAERPGSQPATPAVSA